VIATLILEQLNEDNGLQKQTEFTDEVTFHIWGTVNHITIRTLKSLILCSQAWNLSAKDTLSSYELLMPLTYW